MSPRTVFFLSNVAIVVLGLVVGFGTLWGSALYCDSISIGHPALLFATIVTGIAGAIGGLVLVIAGASRFP